MSAKFTIQHEGSTYDVCLRISTIDNGWVIKAGAAPYYCSTEKEVQVAVTDIVANYIREVLLTQAAAITPGAVSSRISSTPPSKTRSKR